MFEKKKVNKVQENKKVEYVNTTMVTIREAKIRSAKCLQLTAMNEI